MGMNIGRGDNVMKEMAREVNLLEHDRENTINELNQKKRKLGRIACCIILAFIILILALFILL